MYVGLVLHCVCPKLTRVYPDKLHAAAAVPLSRARIGSHCAGRSLRHHRRDKTCRRRRRWHGLCNVPNKVAES
jgi:hypothetical protein